MSDSLRDQLLKSGLLKTLKPERIERRKPQKQTSDARPNKPTRGGKPAAQNSGEIDLARAWALRDRTERETKEREKRDCEQRAREKKERRRKLAALLDGKVLNEAAADIARHFPHGKKISRIYVTAAQLTRLNAGELAVVQQQGRFVLVTRAIADAAATIDPDALALACEPGDVDDDVPADLIW